jgi:hypothetical protein
MGVGDRITRAIPPKVRAFPLTGPIVDTLEHGDIDFHSINTIEKGTERNERDFDRVQFKGVRSDLLVYQNPNPSTDATPVFINMAWIVVKDGAECLLSTTGKPRVDNFFRGYGVQRASAATGANNSALELTINPINSDIWSVLKHKRYLLTGREGNTVWRRSSVMRKRFYIKINKELRFQLASSNKPNNGEMFFAIWAARVTAGRNPGAILNIAQYQQRHLCYFKDPE